MRRVIFFFILLTLAIACGLLIANHPGLVQIETSGYHISMSLWVGVLLPLLFYATLHIAYRLIKGSLRAPKRVRYHFKEKRLHRSRRKQHMALLLHFRGQWQKAVRRWEQAAKTGQHPALHYLLAAACAAHTNDQDNCSKLLAKADKHHADAALIAIVKSWALIEAGSSSEASQHLLLHAEQPQAALALTHIALSNHKGGEALLYLKQAKPAISERKHHDLMKQAIHLRLSELSKEHNKDELTSLRRDYKRLFLSFPDLETAYLSALIDCGAHSDAQKRLLKLLKKEWRETLLPLLAQTEKDNTDALIQTSEDWLSEHPNSSALHAYLGELYLRARRSQKAISYLKQAHNTSPSANTAHLLGQAYSEVGSLEEALRWYAAGCSLD